MSTSSALHGLHIVVTRASEQSHELSQLLRVRGAEPVAWPLLRIAGLSPTFAREWTDAVDSADWVVFCSTNGVRHALPHLPAPWPAHVRVAAVGAKTANALERGAIPVQSVPERYEARGIVGAMRAVQPDLTGARVLLIKGTLSPDDLRGSLQDAGARVSELVVYATLPAGAAAIPTGRLDAITFASGSAVRFAAEALAGRLPDGVCVACIGPMTAQAARDAGWPVHVQAQPHTMPGLVQTLDNHFRTRLACVSRVDMTQERYDDGR